MELPAIPLPAIDRSDRLSGSSCPIMTGTRRKTSIVCARTAVMAGLGLCWEEAGMVRMSFMVSGGWWRGGVVEMSVDEVGVEGSRARRL